LKYSRFMVKGKMFRGFEGIQLSLGCELKLIYQRPSSIRVVDNYNGTCTLQYAGIL
jgi:hypothetical protein